MSILDTFYMLFESDASKLDKGIDESTKKSEKLTQTVAAADKAASKMGDTLKQSLAELGAVVLAAVAFKTLTTNMLEAADAADRMGERAQLLDVSVEALSAWSGAATLAGGSADAFAGSLESLTTSMAQLDVTGKSRIAPFLKELGIDLDSAKHKGQTALELLPHIADSFEGLSKVQSLGIGRKLGLDQGTIMLLQSGRREIDAMIAKQKELGVVTEKQAAISAEFNDQLDMTGMAFRSLWLEVAAYVLPAVKFVMEGFQNLAIFMRKHSDFIVGLMIALGAAILYYVVPPLISAAAAAVVAFAPFILFGAIVAGLAAAFALLYEDIMIFAEGGDSAIGRLLERWPLLGQIFHIIGAVAKEVAALISTVFTAAGEGILALWDHIAVRVKALFDIVKSGAALISGIAGKVFGALTSHQFTAEGMGNAQQQLAAASGTSLGSQTSASITNTQRGGKTTTVQVGKVEVNTQATDAAGISKAIGGSMETQMRQAADNFDDGVLA